MNSGYNLRYSNHVCVGEISLDMEQSLKSLNLYQQIDTDEYYTRNTMISTCLRITTVSEWYGYNTSQLFRTFRGKVHLALMISNVSNEKETRKQLVTRLHMYFI